MTKQNSRRKRESKLEKFSLDELSQLFFFPQDFAAKVSKFKSIHLTGILPTISSLSILSQNTFSTLIT